MSRWPVGARERLERAAFELFAEQGFAETTVPQITGRAGLTTRTFFRHFSDKREVLFVGQDELPALVQRLMAQVPASAGPMAVIAAVLHPFAAHVVGASREQVGARHAIINSDEGLRERELRKLHLLSEAICEGFQKRGADELTSMLAAEIGMTVLRVAITRWVYQTTDKELTVWIDEALGAFRQMVTDQP